jgi:hypothetical protein
MSQLPTKRPATGWTTEDVLALPVTVDLLTAGEVLGMQRTATYRTARDGRFPVPLIRVGSRYRVAAADLRRALGLTSAA